MALNRQQTLVARQQRLRVAMATLVTDPRFSAFMEELAEQQKAAMLDTIHERVVANDRLLSVALGEVRCYQSILDLYASFEEQATEGQE